MDMKEKNPVGRQPRRKEHSDVRINLRVTADEYKLITEAAERSTDGNVSEFIRSKIGLNKGSIKNAS